MNPKRATPNTLISPTAGAVLFCMILSGLSHAAPQITGLSGSVSHKATITISGTGFGIKNPAGPLVWADFEDGTTNANIARSGIEWYANMGAGGGITSMGQDAHSSYSVRGVPYSPTLHSTSKHNVSVVIDKANAEKVYAYIRRKYDHPDYWKKMGQSGYSNYKFFRLWPARSYHQYPYPNHYFIYLVQSPGGPAFNPDNVTGLRTSTETAGTQDNCGFGPAGTIFWSGNPGFPPTQTWLREEYVFKLGNGDGVSRIYSNGNLLMNSNTESSRGGICSDATWERIIPENFWAISSPPSGAYVYFDDVYIDDTWARVMIGDNSNFNSCQHREIQIPTAWSSNSVTINVNQGTFKNGENAFVFVVDENGNKSAGYQIVVGGSSELSRMSVVTPTTFDVSVNVNSGRAVDFVVTADPNSPYTLVTTNIAGRRLWGAEGRHPYKSSVLAGGSRFNSTTQWKNPANGIYYVILKQDGKQASRKFAVIK